MKSAAVILARLASKFTSSLAGHVRQHIAGGCQRHPPCAAGKTTLIDILAGRKRDAGELLLYCSWPRALHPVQPGLYMLLTALPTDCFEGCTESCSTECCKQHP